MGIFICWRTTRGGFDTLENVSATTYKGTVVGRNSFGAFANGGNTIPYSNVELYIMGLIGIDELDDIQIAINPQKTTNSGEFTADEIKVLTPNDIVAMHGSRLPSVSNSQKEFKAITVVISKKALTKEEQEIIHNDITNFSLTSAPDSSWGNRYNFWQATQQKATIAIDVTNQKE